jgi:hypothetical protein
MPAETRETDGWSETVETGYALRFRNTGMLARIHADRHECHPTTYSLTADDEDPIYVAQEAEWLSQVLGAGGLNVMSSEAFPALGSGIERDDLEPVTFERVIRIRTEAVTVELPVVFDPIGLFDLRKEAVIDMVGHSPVLPPGDCGYVAVAVRTPPGGMDATVGQIGRKVFFARSNFPRRLLAVVAPAKCGVYRRIFRDDQGLMLVCSPVC